MTGLINPKINLKLPSLPKGSVKSQDIFYKISMGIVLAVIVYILYQFYKGYSALKSIPEIPKELYEAGKELTLDSLAQYAPRETTEARFEALTPIEKGLVSTGSLSTLGITPQLGAEATLSTIEGLKDYESAYSVTQRLEALNPITEALVGIGNLITGGYASQAGAEVKSWFTW